MKWQSWGGGRGGGGGGRHAGDDEGAGAEEAFVSPHLVGFIRPLEEVAVDVSQQAFRLVDHGLKQTQ